MNFKNEFLVTNHFESLLANVKREKKEPELFNSLPQNTSIIRHVSPIKRSSPSNWEPDLKRHKLDQNIHENVFLKTEEYLQEQELAFKKAIALESSLINKLKKLERLSQSVSCVTGTLFSNLIQCRYISKEPLTIHQITETTRLIEQLKNFNETIVHNSSSLIKNQQLFLEYSRETILNLIRENIQLRKETFTTNMSNQVTTRFLHSTPMLHHNLKSLMSLKPQPNLVSIKNEAFF